MIPSIANSQRDKIKRKIYTLITKIRYLVNANKRTTRSRLTSLTMSFDDRKVTSSNPYMGEIYDNFYTVLENKIRKSNRNNKGLRYIRIAYKLFSNS